MSKRKTKDKSARAIVNILNKTKSEREVRRLLRSLGTMGDTPIHHIHHAADETITVTLRSEPPRLSSAEHLDILRDIESMEPGEFFIYGATYHERKTVQGEELGQCFAYQEELHVSKEDHVQKFHLALQSIADLLNGKEWTSADLETVACHVRSAGYTIDEPDTEQDQIDENNLSTPVEPNRGLHRDASPAGSYPNRSASRLHLTHCRRDNYCLPLSTNAHGV
jgi:hypothetical protein